METKEKTNLPMIKVTPLPNGYSLEFDGMKQKTGYMYFSPDKLLEGFMLHIGIGITDELDTETMQDFIVTAIRWNDNKECVEEIKRLTSERTALRRRIDTLDTRLNGERDRMIRLLDAIKVANKKGEITKDLKNLYSDYSKRYAPKKLSKIDEEDDDDDLEL